MSKKFVTQPRNAPKVKGKVKTQEPTESARIQKNPMVESAQLPDSPVTKERASMELTFTRSNAARKDARLVIFNFADGRPGSVQFLRTAFGDNVPNTITMNGDFAEKTEKVAKSKETPEERKARLAALPKLTLAEKVARAEERTEKLRAKLAKAS